MDHLSLQAFLEVAKSGSFSIAANHLHLTQPAVSKRIATLEARLGSKLFDRIGRRITLTEAGRTLHPQALKILQEMREAERSIHALQDSVGGTLTMGISHHIGLHRLPPVLKSFIRAYPDVQLDIDFMDSEEAHQGVLAGNLELAVVTLDPQSDPALHYETVWTDRLAVVVATDHPLAASNSIELRALSRYPAILPGLNTYTGQIVEALFQQHQLYLDVSMATNYLETIKMMVSIGLGWSILPDTMIDHSLQRLTIPAIKIERKLGYVFHRNRSLTNAAAAFISELNQAIE